MGRTGTFICLHSELERLKTEGLVDLFQAVKSARIQRAGLVPDAVRHMHYNTFIVEECKAFWGEPEQAIAEFPLT